ncbi:hypothetical protein BD413DRAFT_72209 [Trametes elegans]|nr:hypothetical protein BD413DRAFT_72209 [Trametes elegans]
MPSHSTNCPSSSAPVQSHPSSFTTSMESAICDSLNINTGHSRDNPPTSTSESSTYTSDDSTDSSDSASTFSSHLKIQTRRELRRALPPRLARMYANAKESPPGSSPSSSGDESEASTGDEETDSDGGGCGEVDLETPVFESGDEVLVLVRSHGGCPQWKRGTVADISSFRRGMSGTGGYMYPVHYRDGAKVTRLFDPSKGEIIRNVYY